MHGVGYKIRSVLLAGARTHFLIGCGEMMSVRTVVLFVLLAFTGLCFAQDDFQMGSYGTTYLPLDHWAYPVIERAMAKGAIPSQFLGQRPWTRTAIALLLVDRLSYPDEFTQDAESLRLISALEHEFAPEMKVLNGANVGSAQVEQVYTRLSGISGTPLRDSFQLGQTIVNDYGRPYGTGFNNITGAEGNLTYSVFGLQAQGEFQHSSSLTPYTPAQLSSLAKFAMNPTATVPDFSGQDKFEVLDTYAGVSWKRLYVSFGRESNWWGPGESSAMLFSNNVEPMYQIKLDLAEPITLPWILKYLGPVRYQMNFGKLKGHLYPAETYLHGEKISLMPTRNLEIGLSRTTEAFGVGRGFSLHRLLRTYFSVGDNSTSSNPQLDPGDRRGGLDVSYKFPGLRNWLTIYTDSFVDDDPSPLSAPNRAAFHPGFYLSHLPGLPKLDFRAEGAYTELPTETNDHGRFFYWNGNYRDGYTYNGSLIGDWVGRDGKGGQVTTTYWLAPDRKVQLYWRAHMIDPGFIPGGGRQNDIGTNILYAIGGHFQAGGTLQYETYNIPLLAAGRQSDVSVGVTLSYWPHTNHLHVKQPSGD